MEDAAGLTISFSKDKREAMMPSSYLFLWTTQRLIEKCPSDQDRDIMHIPTDKTRNRKVLSQRIGVI
jgi:hypothetical protein